MNKYELLEDMKESILGILDRSESPLEVKEELRTYRKNLENIVEECNSKPESILEYIDMNYGYIEDILKQVNERKINEVADWVMHKCKAIEQDLGENAEHGTKIDIREAKEIMDEENKKAVFEIIGTTCDYINDVGSRATNILASRGYSDDSIYEQKDRIKQLSRSVKKTEVEETILSELRKNDEKILSLIQEEYENYKPALAKEDADKKQTFRESLQIEDLNMEQQRENLEKFLEEQKEKNENKHNEQEIETLDDSFMI